MVISSIPRHLIIELLLLYENNFKVAVLPWTSNLISLNHSLLLCRKMAEPMRLQYKHVKCLQSHTCGL